ncbi:long-chain fatty acid--CoA ligase [Sutterella sp.]|uniref:AMP-dependent synthetase/ligase n=1 Tax=Sutterella sp. TaxID=1981025 RepID=UPI0026E00315|nr:long-chain fatty acid--CoA ligase [Sutterella sp.]MDO5531115.1 long-chain fatty acid--CoA ligase [Sutterella sp.]
MTQNSTIEEGLERIRELDVLATIPELLAHQVEKRPDAIGWKSWDNKKKLWCDWTFRQGYDEVERWRHALAGMGLARGARAAMLLPNCMEAVLFDQSVLANALTPVPLHAIDTPKSSAYILNDSGAELLVTNKKLKWRQIRETGDFPNLKLVVITDDEFCDDPDAAIPTMSLETWLSQTPTAPLPPGPRPTDLAALVYTSGTTGNPKGVMLTHRNVLSNLKGVLKSLQPRSDEVLLSFLPLSHTFERTASYYLAVGIGLTLAFNRSIALLADDLKTIRPTLLMSVPRVYDMIYGKLRDGLAKQSKVVQYMFNWAVEVGWRRVCRENNLPVEPSGRAWLDPLVAGFLDRKVGKKLRDVFGDRIHLYISGGAALNPAVAKVFLGLGVPIYQGYGMTETSPIIAVNRVGSNHPNTVGPAVDNLEVRLSPEGELQVRGPSVMQGYWNREDATKAILSDDGWLSTGDIAEIYSDGHIRITGRIKEIIVTSTGEKVPPADLEAAIETDPLFAQTMAVGDDRICIGLVAVVNPVEFEKLCETLGLDPKDEASYKAREVRQAAIKRIRKAASDFPNYGVPRVVTLLKDPWTIDNGLLTPTLKIKRNQIVRRWHEEIDAMFDEITPKKKSS